MSNEELKELITDTISSMEIDYDDIENYGKIEFELNNGDISFEGKITSYRDTTRPGCGCDIGTFDVEGEIIVVSDDEDASVGVIEYSEKGFEYEYITDYYSYYGVKQSDFI